ncbi:MAG: hypothetical protein CHACPFDD_03121 [Phycisphaerae bacterium]|nr:hypothetical protein [Phycisphaerae bacterium]
MRVRKWRRHVALLTSGALLLQAQGCLVDTNVLIADLTQAVLTVLLDTLVGALSQGI